MLMKLSRRWPKMATKEKILAGLITARTEAVYRTWVDECLTKKEAHDIAIRQLREDGYIDADEEVA